MSILATRSLTWIKTYRNIWFTTACLKNDNKPCRVTTLYKIFCICSDTLKRKWLMCTYCKAKRRMTILCACVFYVVCCRAWFTFTVQKNPQNKTKKQMTDKVMRKVSVSIVTDPGPVKTFLTLSDVTLHVCFQVRAQAQQLFLKATTTKKKTQQDNINGHGTKLTKYKFKRFSRKKKEWNNRHHYLLLWRTRLKIGSFFHQGEKAIAEVVALGRVMDIQLELSKNVYRLNKRKKKGQEASSPAGRGWTCRLCLGSSGWFAEGRRVAFGEGTPWV